MALLGALTGLALLGTPESVVAALAMVALSAAAAWHAAAGVLALVLLTPFLLGEHKTAAFHLLRLLALAVVVSGLVHARTGRLGPLAGRLAPPALFAATAVAAIPLDLRALLEDLWLLDSLDWPQLLSRGVVDVSHLKYLDRVLVTALAAALFVLATYPTVTRAVLAARPALGLLVGAVCAFGLLRFFGVVRTSGQYLTLSFWTWGGARLTAVAWNPDYLALFLVLAFPPCLTAAAAERGARRLVCLAGAGLALGAATFTYQRAAYLALGVELVALASLAGRANLQPARWGRWLAASALGLVALILVDVLLLEGHALGRLARLTEDPIRLRLWHAALRMAAEHPVLGVGTGRYAFFFRDYDQPETLGPFWGTAHSLYLHVLAEQGVVGLASLLWLFGGTWARGIQRLRSLPESDALAQAGLLAALTGWLVYSAVQFTFRVEALTYLAAILAGCVAALAPPDPPGAPLRGDWRRRLVLSLALLTAAGTVGARVGTALRRPLPPGYEAGFYRWERLAEGTLGRWTRRRAATVLRVDGPLLELGFRAPLPGIARRPQVVRVWLEGRPAGRLVLATADWHRLTLPVQAPSGSHVLLELESAYTVTPRRVTASWDDRTLGVMVGEARWPAT